MIFILFIVGTFLNSFAVCFGHDWGQGKINLTRRSVCDNCKAPLDWYQLVPILSLLVSNFSCNKCTQKVSKKYIVYEVIGGVSLPLTFILLNDFTFLTIIIINLIFQFIFVIDLNYYWIPDILQVILLVLLIPMTNLTTIIYSFYLFIILLLLSFLLKNQIGGGDIKLMVILSTVFNYQQIPYFIFLASLLALIYYLIKYLFENHSGPIPFGPFILISFLLIYGCK